MSKPVYTRVEIEAAVRMVLPCPDQIINDDSPRDPEAYRFHWRGDNFRVDRTLFVEEYGGGFLSSSNLCMLLQALLRGKDKDDA